MPAALTDENSCADPVSLTALQIRARGECPAPDRMAQTYQECSNPGTAGILPASAGAKAKAETPTPPPAQRKRYSASALPETPPEFARNDPVKSHVCMLRLPDVRTAAS